MAQETVFGDAEVSAWIKVERANGNVEFYKVIDKQNVAISKEEYEEAHRWQ